MADISAKAGHIVPTALVHRRGRRPPGAPPQFLIGNLGVFGPPDGTVKNEHVYRLTQSRQLEVRASGLEQVVGLAFRRRAAYALELSTTPRRARHPARARSSAVRHGAPPQTIVSGLTFPTGMTVGPDGAFYVSEQGFGFGAGQGRVLRITL